MDTVRNRLYQAASLLVILTMLLSAIFISGAAPAQAQTEPPENPESAEDIPLDDPSIDEIGQVEPETGALFEQAAQDGRVSVIVALNVADAPETAKPGKVYAAAQDALTASMARFNPQNIFRYNNFPLVAMSVDSAGLRALLANPLVAAVQADHANSPSLYESTNLIGAIEAAAGGYNGLGVAVAILDTGVDSTHAFLAGRIVAEACFSGGNGRGTSLCPNGNPEQYGTGAGVSCTALTGCDHGTHVAGIAAGNGASAGTYFSGVAKNASIIAINVFTNYGGNLTAFDSDIIKGLDYVYGLRYSYLISSVNMSLGGSTGYTKYCNTIGPAMKKSIDNLRKAKIATVIASGNDGYTNKIAYPGCISSAVSVGSTTKSDVVSDFSNSASFLSLLAPGSEIYSSVPGGYANKSGTSMATPHVTGAWAVLRQAFPNKSVSSLLSLLKSTGKKVKDPRNNLVKPRINLAAAVAKYIKPTSAVSLISPENGTALTHSYPWLEWSTVPLATKYKITIKRGSATVYSKTMTACPYYWTICYYHAPLLKAGSFTWYVQPISGGGSGPASTPPFTFTTPTVLPSSVTLTTPIRSGQGAYPVQFEWSINGSPPADKYVLKIYRNNALYFNKTYFAYDICGGTCGVQKTIAKEGFYRWEVKPWNPVGYGPKASANFDYFLSNGYDNHFDTDMQGITWGYPYYWWLESSKLVSYYGADYTWATVSVNAGYTNVDATSVIYRTGDTSTANALVLRADPRPRENDQRMKFGYFFEYANDGSFSVWKVNDASAYALQSWAASSAIIQNGTNTLRATTVGSNLSFYINGTLVWSGTDTLATPAFTSGVVSVTSFVPTWSVYYDYLYIDRITSHAVTTAAADEAQSVSPEQQALNEVANANPTGSIYGPNISASEMEALQAQSQSMTPQQKYQACLEAGGPCPPYQP